MAIQQSSLQALLTDPLKQQGKSADILCHLFRDVLIVRSITPLIWTTRLYPAYMDRKEDREERKDRGNLNNQLTSNKFSWTVFKRGIEFLSPQSASFSVVVKFKGEEDTRTYVVHLDPSEDETNDYIDDVGISPDTVIPFQDEKQKDSTLARLFKAIVRDLGLDKETWKKLINDFVDHPYNVGTDQSGKVRRRRSIDADFRRKQFSWRLFRQGLLFLQVEHTTYRLTMQWSDTDTTCHEVGPLPT